MQLLPIVYCKTSNNHLLIPFYPTSLHLKKIYKKYSDPIFGMRFTATVILTVIALLRWGSQAVGKSIVKGGCGCFSGKLGPDHHKRYSNFL
jgi:hypothetical protein